MLKKMIFVFLLDPNHIFILKKLYIEIYIIDKEHNLMELLIPLGIIGVWIVLNKWVLPRLGVST